MTDLLSIFPKSLPGGLDLADALLKTSALLLLALVAVLVFHRRSPAWKSWILSLARCSMLPVFVLSFFLPTWRWQAAPSLSVTAAPAELAEPGAPTPLVVNLLPLTLPGESGSSAAFPAAPSWETLISAAWLTGAVVVGLLWIHRLLRARRVRRTFVEVRRGSLLGKVQAAAKQAGLGRCPTLFTAGPGIMPCTWGIRRPALLLPRGAEAWPEQRLAHVLAHEMAHIARLDVLWSALAVPAGILLWFNPLEWITRQLAGQFREAACDDWVVTRGDTDAPSYTADLLAIVRAAQHSPTSCGGMAMARSTAIAGRVRRLLKPDATRTAPNRHQQLTLAGTWLSAAVLTTVLVSCKTPMPALPADPPAAPPRISISGKKNPGKDTLQFSLIEITAPAGHNNPFLKAVRNSQAGALAGLSLRDLSQQRGVDLLTLPALGENQTLDFATTGPSVILSGEKSPSGSTILTTAKVRTAPDSPVSDFTELRIPNGGFTLLPGTWRSRRNARNQWQESVLALAANSAPMPAAAKGSETSFPLPGDASLPSGARMIRYDVVFLEKEAGTGWPDNLPPPPRCSAEEADAFIRKVRKSRGITTASYPSVTSRAGREVEMRSVVNKPHRRPPGPGEPIKDSNGNACQYVEMLEVGSKLKLNAHPSGESLNLDLAYEDKEITGYQGSPDGYRLPITQSISLNNRSNLTGAEPCVILTGMHSPGKKPGGEIAIMVTVTQSVNP